MSEILHQLDTGAYMKPGKTTVSDYLPRWLAEYAKPNLSPRTTEGYEKIVSHYLIPQFGNLILAELKPEHLQKFYSQEVEQGLSPQTVRNHHTMIHKALDDAVEWSLIARNVADAVKPPRLQHHEMQTWDENEIIQFLEAAKATPYYEIFYTALFTGMRRSELLAMPG
ncbi:tyrosine recombinase XerC [Chloroflexota bacterium]